MYMMDIVNDWQSIERQLNAFRKTATETVYSSYLDLLNRADSSQFCNVSDSYNFSQTLRN